MVFAHPSRQAAWKTCEHLGMGRTLSPDLISSWHTVQTFSANGISKAGDWPTSPLAATPAGCRAPARGAAAADSCEALSLAAPVAVGDISLRPMPAPEPSASRTDVPSTPPWSCCTQALRTPQSHCRRRRCALAGGTPSRPARASWKPSCRLPGPRSSSLSVDSGPPGPPFAWAPSSASNRSLPAPASLARRCAKARAQRCRRRMRARPARNWMRPASSRWARRSAAFSSSVMSIIRCKELTQSAESRTTSTKNCESFCRARQAHITQNLALMRMQPPQTKRPTSGPWGSMRKAGK
mmetsp:Transcript_115894/g.322694  ORF Transcript_115894/g.322694 Transcript_115894/m.322694 type:complete len:296 (+) Transcript_115894:751-1638(+)